MQKIFHLMLPVERKRTKNIYKPFFFCSQQPLFFFNVFSFQILYSSFLTSSLLWFLCTFLSLPYLLKFSLSSSTLPLSSLRILTTNVFFLFFFNFYCYSITVVCLFSPSLHPTSSEPTSLPHLHPPPWFCPCVL